MVPWVGNQITYAFYRAKSALAFAGIAAALLVWKNTY